ncbi:immunoglobulin-binding protein 1 [Xiphophorus hellerii]|uniref:immunoglobulin-binding protein 1 n=1 Tax=Xiphophorus hellerii TaxID=8084 RepID=UPI0013B42ABA|nr:immunoglobulin-binding protein 1 [Xiphophorus hellerii]
MAESIDNAAEQSSAPDTEQLKLSDLLERGWKILQELDSSNEPFGPNTVHRIKRGINMLEDASRMVVQLDLFSRNEEVEEIATADLKYLLLPALLGALHMKQSSPHKRLETVQIARAYFMDFLKTCHDYNISQFELPKPSNENGVSQETSEGVFSKAKSFSAGPSNLVAMAAKRQAKIERYRQRKELETRLSDVHKVVESGQADDEVSREFYLLNVQRWITVCLEEMEAIDQEVEILKNMDLLKQSRANQPAQPPRNPMKPFILTRDALQAQVLGAGYPSLPTMTVDDWYEQHRKHGVLPDQGMPSKVAVEDNTDEQARDEEKEKKAENDDEASLLKARNWDEWKDDHRRGYGNRHNMG